MSKSVVHTFVPPFCDITQWPMNLDVESDYTLQKVVDVRKIVSEEYTAVRCQLREDVERAYGAARIQSAWRRHRDRKLLADKTRQLHSILTQSIETIRTCLLHYGEDRLAPTVEELAAMNPAAQLEYLYSVKPLHKHGSLAYLVNVLKLLVPGKHKRCNVSRGLTSRPEKGRVALVIVPEQQQQGGETSCPPFDLQPLESLLRDHGFLMLKAHAPTLRQLEDLLEAFFAVAKNDVIAMLLYCGRTYHDTASGAAGHYLIPSDAAADITPENAAYECYPTSRIVENLRLPANIVPVMIVVDPYCPTPDVPFPSVPEGFVLVSNSVSTLELLPVPLSKPHSLFAECMSVIAAREREILRVRFPAHPPLPFFIVRDPVDGAESRALRAHTACGSVAEALIGFGMHTGRMEWQTKQARAGHPNMTLVLTSPAVYICSEGRASDIAWLAEKGAGLLVPCGAAQAFYRDAFDTVAAESPGAEGRIVDAQLRGDAVVVYGRDHAACGECIAGYMMGSLSLTLRDALSALLRCAPSALPCQEALVRLAQRDLDLHGEISLHCASDVQLEGALPALDAAQQQAERGRAGLYAAAAALRFPSSEEAGAALEAALCGAEALVERAHALAEERDGLGLQADTYRRAVLLGLGSSLHEKEACCLAQAVAARHGCVGACAEQGAGFTLVLACTALRGAARAAWVHSLQGWARRLMLSCPADDALPQVEALCRALEATPRTAPAARRLRDAVAPFAEGGACVCLPQEEWSGAAVEAALGGSGSLQWALPAPLQCIAAAAEHAYAAQHPGRRLRVVPGIGEVEVAWCVGRKKVALVMAPPAAAILSTFAEEDSLAAGVVQQRCGLPDAMFIPALVSLLQRRQCRPVLLLGGKHGALPRCRADVDPADTVSVNTSFHTSRSRVALAMPKRRVEARGKASTPEMQACSAPRD